ncbi:hypothetical protein Lser_V15G06280 [Lactuca serriola]
MPFLTFDAYIVEDLSRVLSGLTKEFNIDKFLGVFLESLMEYCIRIYYNASQHLCKEKHRSP